CAASATPERQEGRDPGVIPTLSTAPARTTSTSWGEPTPSPRTTPVRAAPPSTGASAPAMPRSPSRREESPAGLAGRTRPPPEPSHHTGQGGGPVHGGVVDGDDEVALAQRGVVGWAARLDADHLGAAVDGAVGRCAAVGAGHADEGVVGGAVLT